MKSKILFSLLTVIAFAQSSAFGVDPDELHRTGLDGIQRIRLEAKASRVQYQLTLFANDLSRAQALRAVNPQYLSDEDFEKVQLAKNVAQREVQVAKLEIREHDIATRIASLKRENQSERAKLLVALWENKASIASLRFEQAQLTETHKHRSYNRAVALRSKDSRYMSDSEFDVYVEALAQARVTKQETQKALTLAQRIRNQLSNHS